MAAVTLDIQGGEKLQRRLAQIVRQLDRGRAVRVGFLEGAKYPETDSYDRFRAGVAKLRGRRPPKKTGRVTQGKFVATVAFWNEFGTIRSKPRPFFRMAIAKNSPHWGDDFAKYARETDYNGERTFRLMGELIQSQIMTSINEWPADNAALTVAIKGFNKGLIDSSTMLNRVDYEVIT